MRGPGGGLTARGDGGAAVIAGSPLSVAEDRVRANDLPERLTGTAAVDGALTATGVRVVPAQKGTVGALDLLLGGFPGEPQRCVEVGWFDGHGHDASADTR
jgi:hypothetical protein